MNNNMRILPGIKEIGWVDCEKLPKMVSLQAICERPIAVLTEITNIEFAGEPECSCETTKTAGDKTDSCKLSFIAGELLPLHRKLGFVVTDVNGESWLIGAHERPHPKVLVGHKLGRPGETAGYQYEVTHQAIKSLLHCIK